MDTNSVSVEGKKGVVGQGTYGQGNAYGQGSAEWRAKAVEKYKNTICPACGILGHNFTYKGCSRYNLSAVQTRLAKQRVSMVTFNEVPMNPSTQPNPAYCVSTVAATEQPLTPAALQQQPTSTQSLEALLAQFLPIFKAALNE
jgi:hypothetical protein